MNPVDPSDAARQRIIPSEALQQAQTADVSSSSTNLSSNELGRVAQDVGSVINKWQSNLNTALTKWAEDINDMSALMDEAKFVVNELQAMIVAYQTHPGGLKFVETNYDRIVSAMTALGIPESQIQGGTLEGDGYYYFTGTQFANDIKMMVQYLVKDIPQFAANLSGYQSDETKDLMAVMFCTNSIRMNEESLTGLLQELTSLSQTLMQNVGS